jgi:hypothetical protein
MDIPLISYISSILSRLSYMNNTNFLHYYDEIFKVKELRDQLHKIKEVDDKDIFEPIVNNIDIINKKINTITKKHLIHKSDDSSNVKYISISTSNYSSVYIVADKLTNTIFIAFRGTYSLKSALAYFKLTSIEPYKICKNNPGGLVLGIFKIVGEIFYTIKESIHFLSSTFLKTNNYKLVSTGHSLGGGCSQIFSYILVKQNPKIKITCVTFGGPRVFNKYLVDKFNNYIERNIIMFKRYVTNGDPITLLPLTRKKGNVSYYHPDEGNDKMDYTAIVCRNVKKTQKALCNLRNKSKKNKPDLKFHGTYLGLSYSGAGEDILKTTKEIVRSHGNTVCRIIFGGNNEKSRAVFFLLDDLKTKTKTNDIVSEVITRLKKTFTTDYKHQDIYMNTRIFNDLLKKSVVLDDDNMNPTLFTELVEIDQGKGQPELYCV